MKLARIGVLIGGLAMATQSSAPAQAATATIAGTAVAVSATRQAFVESNCDATVIGLPSADAAIVEVSGRQNQFTNFSWSSPAANPQSRLNVFFYGPSCNRLETAGGTAIVGPSRVFHIPVGTKWTVVESYFTPAVTLNIG